MTITILLETLTMDPAPIQYDIFLSYSHRDDTQANRIIKLLQKLDPKLRVFFDIQELKTGKAWQRTLYHSIDGSRCLLALISENYTKSPVCQEEYNLALAKHCSGDGSMQLIPLCLEEMKEVPATFSKVKMVKATPDVFDSVTSAVCKAVVSWLTGKDVDPNVEHILEADENPSCDMDKVGEDQRRADFTTKYGTEDKKLLSMEKRFPAKLQGLMESRPSSAVSRSSNTQEAVDIVFSCAKEDWKYASFLKAVFKDAAPSLVVKATVKSEKERLTLMDTARCVVAFLSPGYLDSPEQVEEFHIALCRQRLNPSTVLFPITVHTLPQKPTYFHLVPSALNITDAMWAELAHKWNVEVPNLNWRQENAPGITVPAEVALGLHEAACILINALKTADESDQAAGGSHFSRPVLHNVLKIQDEVISGSKDQADGVDLAKILVTLNITADETTTNMSKDISIDNQELAKDSSSPNTKEPTPEEAAHEQTTTTEPIANSPTPEAQTQPVITEPVVNPEEGATQESNGSTPKHSAQDPSHQQASETREPSTQDSDNKTTVYTQKPAQRPKSAMCELV